MARFLEVQSLKNDFDITSHEGWNNIIIDLSKIEVILLAEITAGISELTWRHPTRGDVSTFVIKEPLDILAFKVWGN